MYLGYIEIIYKQTYIAKVQATYNTFMKINSMWLQKNRDNK